RERRRRARERDDERSEVMLRRSGQEENTVINGIRVAAVMLVAVAPVLGADWPQFRGPDGAAVADGNDLPVKWSATENIRWKAPLPGKGLSSPVVAGEKVFVTACSA